MVLDQLMKEGTLLVLQLTASVTVGTSTFNMAQLTGTCLTVF